MNAVNSVETASPATPAVLATPPAAAASTAPAAGLNSVQQVVPQPTYTFNPERFSEITDRVGSTTDFWKLSMVIPVQCG